MPFDSVKMMTYGVLVAVCLLLAGCAGGKLRPRSAGGIPADYVLLYEQEFADGAGLDDFVFADRAAWRWVQIDGRGTMNQFAQSHYRPPHRSPVNLALLASHLYGDFVVELQVMQTGKEYGHRDMCVVFGFEDPANYYYVHLAPQPDANAHGVFMVNDWPRVNITTERNDGIAWGRFEWHTIRIERALSNGAVFVFFDDLKEPIMWAQDKNLGWGRIGIGTFDDTGLVGRLRVWAPEAKELEGERNPFVKRPDEEETTDLTDRADGGR